LRLGLEVPEDEANRLFEQARDEWNLGAARFLYERFGGILRPDLMAYRFPPFSGRGWVACVRGDLPFVRFLDSIAGPDGDVWEPEDDPTDNCCAFCDAALNGQHNVIRWLYRRDARLAGAVGVAHANVALLLAAMAGDRRNPRLPGLRKTLEWLRAEKRTLLRRDRGYRHAWWQSHHRKYDDGELKYKFQLGWPWTVP
jgi:hypothetical protein